MNTILKTLRTPVLAASALALAATGLSAFPAPATAQSATDRAQIDTAVGALRAISTMRADFVQTDRNGQRVGGVMTLKRPGKIRFQYQKGVPFLIVADGSSLTRSEEHTSELQSH